MKKLFIFPILYLMTVCSVFGQQINGIIYYQNSGGKTAEGIEVSAFGCDTRYTKSNGMFILPCLGKKAGQQVKLIIGSKDAQGKNIEVVNTRQLEWLRVSDNPSDAPIDIIVCYAGQRDKAALKFYGILVEANNKEYETRLANIEAKLGKVSLETNERRVFIEQLDDLKKQRDQALQRLEEQAQFIANINQDKASNLVKSAIQKIEQGNDVDAAISILDDSKLEEIYKLALAKKVEAETEIKQVIEGYELKSSLLEAKHKYKEAILCYEYIIEIYKKNNLNKAKLAVWYIKAADIIYYEGNYKKALEYQQISIDIQGEVLGPKHPDLANSYGNIGNTYQLLGDYKKALEYQQKAISIQEDILDPKHRDLANSYGNIGGLYYFLGQYEKALEYQQKSIVVFEEVLNPKHRELANSYNNIALTYQSLGQYEKALEYQQKAIDIQEEILDPDHPHLATSYGNVGGLYYSLGQYKKALGYQQKAISIQEDILGSKHPYSATLYSNIAMTYLSLGEYEKALEYQQKAISIHKETLDLKHPSLATYYSNIGNIYHSLGQYKNALEYQQKAISIQEDILGGPTHPSLATFYNNIAIYYQSLGQYEKALEYQQKSIGIQEKVLGPKHPSLAVSYGNIGITYCTIEQYDMALKYLQKAIGIQEEVLGLKHPDLLGFYSYIFLTYLYLGQYEKTLEYQQKAIKIQEDILDAKHTDLVVSYNNISKTHQLLGQYEKALEYQQKVINIQEEVLDAKHPDLVPSYNDIVKIYQLLKEYEKALEYQQKAIGIQEEILDPKHPDLHVSYLNIAFLYKKMKEFEKAIEMQVKVLTIFKTSTLESNPEQQSAFNTLLEIYFEKAIDAFEQKKYATALICFDTLNNHLNNGDILNSIGLCHYYLSNYPKAIKAYQKAVEILPEQKTRSFYHNIGMAYAKNKQFKEAYSAFTENEKLFPNESKSYRNWAMYYALQGDKVMALQFLQKAVDLGYKDLEWLKTDDSIESLRKEQVFIDLINKLEKSKDK